MEFRIIFLPQIFNASNLISFNFQTTSARKVLLSIALSLLERWSRVPELLRNNDVVNLNMDMGSVNIPRVWYLFLKHILFVVIPTLDS